MILAPLLLLPFIFAIDVAIGYPVFTVMFLSGYVLSLPRIGSWLRRFP